MIPTTRVIGVGDTKGRKYRPPSLDQVWEYIRASKAENTLRGYRADWREFCAWCETRDFCALPASPEAVAAYIAECAVRLKVKLTKLSVWNRRCIT